MSQLLVNIILSFSIYLLVSISFSIIYYSVKFFNIAHAAIISIGAYYVLFFFSQGIQLKIILIPLAIILSIFTGVICEIFVYRHLRKIKMPPLSYLICSLGIYVILQNLISIYFGDDSKVITTSVVSVGNQVFGAYITNIQILIIITSIILFIGLNLLLLKSSLGKAIRAVSDNSELSNIYGINSNRIILYVFIIGSALASIAGILSALDTYMTPTFGFNLLLYGVVAMVIGGVGSTRGLIAGSFLVAAAQHLSGFYLDTKWMDAITYFILILFLIWKPLGFSGKQLKKVEV